MVLTLSDLGQIDMKIGGFGESSLHFAGNKELEPGAVWFLWSLPCLNGTR